MSRGSFGMGGRFGHDVCLGSRQCDCPAALQPEQQQQRDQQREDAERFGDGEAENQVAELTLRWDGLRNAAAR